MHPSEMGKCGEWGVKNTYFEKRTGCNLTKKKKKKSGHMNDPNEQEDGRQNIFRQGGWSLKSQSLNCPGGKTPTQVSNPSNERLKNLPKCPVWGFQALRFGSQLLATSPWPTIPSCMHLPWPLATRMSPEDDSPLGSPSQQPRAALPG